MSLWDNVHLFVGCGTNILKINLISGKIVKKINCNKKEILTIKKIIHPFYGECLLFQGEENNCIKLLFFEN